MSQHKLIAGAVSVALHVVLLAALALHGAARTTPVGMNDQPQTFEIHLVQSSAQSPVPAADGVNQNDAPVTATGSGAAATLETEREASSPASASHPGGAPPAAASPTYMSSGDYLDYQRRLLAHIRPYQFYPDAGRQERLQGVVRVGFALQRDGRVREIWVESSSGYALLDEAAMDTVRRAQPLPLIPAILPDAMDVMLPIAFSPPMVLGRG